MLACLSVYVYVYVCACVCVVYVPVSVCLETSLGTVHFCKCTLLLTPTFYSHKFETPFITNLLITILFCIAIARYLTAIYHFKRVKNRYNFVIKQVKWKKNTKINNRKLHRQKSSKTLGIPNIYREYLLPFRKREKKNIKRQRLRDLRNNFLTKQITNTVSSSQLLLI